MVEEIDLDLMDGLRALRSDFSTDSIHVNDLPKDQAEAIRRVQTQLGHLTPPLPQPTDRSLAGRVTVGPVSGSMKDLAEIEKELTAIESQLNQENPPAPHSFPNLGLEAVLLAMAKEKQTNEKLKEHIQEADKHQKDIDLLLDLSAKLTQLKEDQNEVPQDVKDLLHQLQERGIDLWKEDVQLNKEKIAELKSLSSAQVDKIRSNLNRLMATKINVLIQMIGAILESTKEMVRQDSKLKSTANRLPGH